MANQFKHKTVGTELTQTEWEATTAHEADGETANDMLYFNGTNWIRATQATIAGLIDSEIQLDNLGTPDDNTDLDASGAKHGLMPKADSSKLAAIEASATADQTGAEIKTAYETEADTNAYDDAAVSKLAGITAGATVYPDTGEQAFLDADHTKLDGVATGADVTGDNAPQAHTASHTDGTDDIQDAAADDSTKGIATFEADDFDDSSGKIDLAASVTKASTTDSGTATPTGHDLGIKGGEGIDTSGAGTQVTITGEDASDSNKGIAELATAAETTTGTDAGRVVTPDGLAGSAFGKRTMSLLVNNSTALTSGDGKAYFPRIPSYLNGWNIIEVAANMVAGTAEVEIQLYNLTQTADILSTTLTIDANEKDSKDAATPAVIDTGEDDLQTGDRIRIDIDGAGTGTTWLDVQFTAQLP